MPVDPTLDNDALYRGIHAHDCENEHEYDKFTTLVPVGCSVPVFSVVITPGTDIKWAAYDTTKDCTDKKYQLSRKVCWITSHLNEGELSHVSPGYLDSMTEITHMLYGHLPSLLHAVMYGENHDPPSRGKAVQKSIERMHRCGLGSRYLRVYVTLVDEKSDVCQQQLDMMRRLWAYIPSIVVQPVVHDFSRYYLNDQGFELLSDDDNNDVVDSFFLTNLIGCFGYCKQNNSSSVAADTASSCSSFLFIQARDCIAQVVQYVFIHSNKSAAQGDGDGDGDEQKQSINVQTLSSLASKFESSDENVSLEDLEKHLMEHNYKPTNDDGDNDQINSLLLEYRALLIDAISTAYKGAVCDDDGDASFQILLSGGKAGAFLYELLTECKMIASEEFATLGEAKSEIVLSEKQYEVIFSEFLCHSGVLHTVCNGSFVEKSSSAVKAELTAEVDMKDDSVSFPVGEGAEDVAHIDYSDEDGNEVIGKRVAKFFENQLYYGTVVRFEAVRGRAGEYYFIQYDDGDKEHVPMNELKRLLNLYSINPEASRSGGVVEEFIVSSQPKPAKKAKRDNAMLSAEKRPSSEKKRSAKKKPKPSENPSEYIGERVAKRFADGVVYYGTVVKYTAVESSYDAKNENVDAPGGFWFIYYDDDDREDFELHDMENAVKLYKRYKKQDVNPPKLETIQSKLAEMEESASMEVTNDDAELQPSNAALNMSNEAGGNAIVSADVTNVSIAADAATHMEVAAEEDAQIVDADIGNAAIETAAVAEVADASVVDAGLDTQQLEGFDQTQQSNASSEFLTPEDGPVTQQPTAESLTEE